MLRNIASQKWRVYAWDTTTGQAKTGDAAQISAYITVDAGTPAATNDAAPTELSATNEPGYYEFDLTQAETNGSRLALSPKSSTADIEVVGIPPVVYTQPQYLSLLGIESDGDLTKVNTLNGHTAQTGDNYARLGTPADTDIATDIANVNTAVGAIGVASGSGLNFAAEADNTGGAIKSITFVGSQTGTYANTEANDGTYHQIDDTGDAIDIVYQFDVEAIRIGIVAAFKGYVSGSNDTITVQAYDFVGADWEDRATITGQAGTDNITQNITLLTKHTGTGADAGLVLMRFVCSAQSNPVLLVDELLIEAAIAAQTVGYADGAVWLDTSASNTNTSPFVDGVADNPVSTLAAALTLSASVGIKRIRVLSGSSITLTSTQTGCEFLGNNWNLAFGGQAVTNCTIQGASLSGTVTGSGTIYENCIVEAAITIPPSTMRFCYFGDITVTAGSEGDFFLNDCRSRVAGTESPLFDFGSARNASRLSIRSYSGGMEIANMGAGTGTYNMSLEGDGALTVNANCTGGSVAVRGNFKITDNASGAVSITPTVPTITQVNQGVAQGGTSTTITLAATASSTDGQYDPGEVVIVTGMGAGQTRSIIDYNGTTKVAVIDKDWRQTPDTTSSYVITSKAGALHVNEGQAQGGASTTITLNSVASATDDIYNGQTVFLVGGTGQDQRRTVTAYNGTTKVATMDRAWDVTPDATTSYVMIPIASQSAGDIWGNTTRTLSAADNITGDGSTITVTAGSVTLANGVSHGGSTATLELGASGTTIPFQITQSGTGHAWVVTAAGSAADALQLNGGGANAIVTDGAGFRAGGMNESMMAGNYDLSGVGSTLTTILADTNELQTDDVPGLIAALNNISTAQVNAEMVDALQTDTPVDGKSITDALQIIGATSSGLLPSGAGTSTEAFVGLDQSTTRVTFTVDGDGNRTAVVYG